MAQSVRTSVFPRALAGLLVLAVAAALAFVGGPSARGAESVSTRRLGGVDRYDTARQIAVTTFGTSDFVILARGDDYPDALAGTYVAGAAPGAPILLTPKDSLSPSAVQGIQTLGADGVIILGGTEAISQGVENDLKSRGLATKRLFGADRYATAAAIAKSVTPPGSHEGKPTALIASGEVFADALTGGPMSYVARFPMLLTTAANLPAPTDTALTDLGIKHAIILGGTDRITAVVEARLTAKGITSERLSGATRRGTATAIAQFARAELGFGGTHLNLARGDEFPDALAGGPHAGTEKAPILLTDNPGALGAETQQYLRANADTIQSIDALGGTSAISDATLAAADTAATCLPPTTSTTSASTSTSSTSSTSSSSTSSTTSSSTTSTTAAQATCGTSSSTSSSSSSSTTSTTTPPSGGLCSVLPIAGCPGATTTTSSPSTSTTSTSTTSTTAP
jgi:putative cell wall-binding protein